MNIRPLALAILLALQPVLAADDKVMLNFVNADIESTVKAVGLITGKNFIIDPRVKGVVNIVSASPVAKGEVFNIMLSALRLQGFAVVETGSVVRILPEADAKQNFGITIDKQFPTGNRATHGDRIITQVYPLKHESASQIVPILRPLIAPNNTIAAYPAANLIVITDYADNIQRINQIIANIDQPSSSDITILPLKYASALEVAQTIARLLPEVSTPGVTSSQIVGAAEGVKKTLIIPDIRANTLMVRGENAAHMEQIKRITASLDKQGSTLGNIRVIYLKNADATKLAALLKAILSGQDAPQISTPSSTSSNNPPGSPPQPAVSSVSSSISGGSTPQGVAIQADATTNSLIITAPDNLYNSLRAVIDKLDARRAQVYVEAMIAEVNVDKAGQFGVQWLLGGGNKNVTGIGASALGSGANSITSVAAGIAAKDISKLPSGFSLGVINGSLSDGGKLGNLGVLATAIETSGGGNVLSTPNILTLDNEEAKIIVGNNVPFITGTQSSTGNNPNPFTTVERKDVGIQLRVKPQVSEGGAITMQLYQEISNVVTNTDIQTGNAGLVTRKRSIESKILVDDGQIIVIGGLIENTLDQTSSKVPLLGDIPFLGNLFKYETRNHKRTNLMVFLRPVILRDGPSAQALTNDRYQMLQETQRASKSDDHLLLPNQPDVTLPIFDARGLKSEPKKAAEPPATAQ